ncbi:MAG TPA: N-acetyltransferase [Dyella sp.]|uniref:GNAT family N-acetyltransferase n=1 Tax=Dyella sp. TaxID=1869338 RepID=UPI002D77CAF5|nr:N-acetyltransferase [Dyella sp.]HET6552175.1 N-acetyltransferase [Dyella sp.]
MGTIVGMARPGLQVHFRPAVPADADVAVPLIYSSGPAAFDFVFATREGDDALDFLNHCFVDGAGEFGWRNHWVGTVEERVVAVGAGFGADAKWPFMLAAARQIFGYYGWRKSPGVVSRGLRVESVIRPPEGDMHYLAHLGVLPELRGHGVGRALIDQLIGVGREAGRRRVTLDVAASNPRAESLYQRAGFKITGERRSRLSNERSRVPDHRRMERMLD